MTAKVLALHGGLFAGVAVGAVVLALLWPAQAAAQRTAAVGAAMCAGSGALALLFKRRARSLNAALLVVVLVFGVRAALVTAGALLAQRLGGGAMPFVWGFFGTYFPLQWIEVSYLVQAAKQTRSQAER
ncbi:MAG: hypothetical protein IRZ16_02000 [Myxococcaceae bacterium]|nr:hypothetical protein [Myxococcaceae bacterium]